MTAAPDNPAPANDAAAAYARRRGEIARLLDVLEMELAKHAQAFEADPRNWGRVGDLAAVRGTLVNAVVAISGVDPEAIEGFLAE
ncbi:hypothetical protein [Actinomadura sp.]|uniref:hypothetical protein n=1 Tax=Actinomadura sp. TaxID=1989 RepID=UPI0037CA57F2